MPMKPKLALELLHPTFGVVIVGVASINQQIAFFEIGGELINNLSLIHI